MKCQDSFKISDFFGTNCIQNKNLGWKGAEMEPLKKMLTIHWIESKLSL